MRRNLIIGIGAAVLVSVLGAIVAYRWLSTPPPAPVAAVGLFERPMPWTVTDNATPGSIDVDRALLTVGGVEMLAPQPVGMQVRWKHEERGLREALVGLGEYAGNPARFEWKLATGSPHTLFEGSLSATRAALTEPIVSAITLPDGELTYVDGALMRVPFAGTATVLDALTSGPVVWRRGNDVVSLSQWSAERVTLAASEAGGYVVQFHWWDPELHETREGCEKQLAELQIALTPSVTISFGAVPDAARGRLPKGVASAVVPIFFDPLHVEDPRFQDAASASAEDYAVRARTIAFGHSSPKDARHGNGGLAGLEVGGTIVVPAAYAADDAVFAELVTAVSATTIELVPEAELRPSDCTAWAAALAQPDRALLRASRTFDGKFPNLFGNGQRTSIPGMAGEAATWQATQLTGRRKDVVMQALSSTYLSRLADARGIAILEIPIVATRNPLVAASAEALLEPERAGHWTIQDDLARALGEVELLSEGERFDFVGIRRLASYTRRASQVVFDEVGDGTWLVHNNGAEAVDGYTLVLSGAVAATVDGEPVKSAARALGNGDTQTWLWWDLSPGATYTLGITRAEATPRTGVSWQIAK